VRLDHIFFPDGLEAVGYDISVVGHGLRIMSSMQHTLRWWWFGPPSSCNFGCRRWRGRDEAQMRGVGRNYRLQDIQLFARLRATAGS
jgi:hypothetical protein